MRKTVHVDLGPSSYDVVIEPGLLAQLGKLASDAVGGAGSAIVVTESNVAPLYGPRALETLRSAGLSVTLIEFPAGEEHKTLSTAGHLFDMLFAALPPVDRDTLVVALGGGVTGDMAGFVAAIALRGLRWIQCPTTLLADVDASVGGKTAVDHPAGKNLIGAFHQPRGVFIDIATLATLPSREMQSGLAECVKHAIIRDASLLAFIEQNASAILAFDLDVLTELVARNVAIKAAVVSADVREMGQRAHLNFGHTVGHAIETLAGYGGMSHGQAVALGMICACDMARSRKLIDESLCTRLRNVLQELGLSVTHADLDATAVWKLMQHDKKTRGGKVRMVLPTGLGQVDIFADVTQQEVQQALAAIAD